MNCWGCEHAQYHLHLHRVSSLMSIHKPSSQHLISAGGFEAQGAKGCRWTGFKSLAAIGTGYVCKAVDRQRPLRHQKLG